MTWLLTPLRAAQACREELIIFLVSNLGITAALSVAYADFTNSTI
jgi:hypothetical protein